MWDVGGDSFDSLGGVGILEVADLSLDEPELQAVSFGLDELPVDIVDDNETIEEQDSMEAVPSINFLNLRLLYLRVDETADLLCCNNSTLRVLSD